MKKLFIVLAVASLGFVACNNESTTETSTEDSIRIADSIKKAQDAMTPVVPDSTGAGDTMKTDTTKAH
jgi:hypothetical protein